MCLVRVAVLVALMANGLFAMGAAAEERDELDWLLNELDYAHNNIFHAMFWLDSTFDRGAMATLNAAYDDNGIWQSTRDLYAALDAFALTDEYRRTVVPVSDQSLEIIAESRRRLLANPDGIQPGDYRRLIYAEAQWRLQFEFLKHLLEARVGLMASMLLALQEGFAAEDIDCKQDAACETARQSLIAGLETRKARIGEEMAANAREIAAANRQFFTVIGTPVTACTSLALSYTPQQVERGKDARALLGYSPQGCARTGPPDYEIVEQTGEAAFRLVGRYGEGVVAPTTYQPGTARIRVLAEGLSTEAIIAARQGTPCADAAWAVPSATLRPGARNWVALDFRPKGCWFDGQITGSSSNDGLLYAEVENRGVLLFARGLGNATVEASMAGHLLAPLRVSIVDGEDPCTNLTAHYPLQFLRSGSTLAPDPVTGLAVILDYTPEGCRRPKGSLKFQSLTPQTVSLATDYSQDLLRAGNPGLGRIGISHGDLHAVASITVEPVPECNSLDLTLQERLTIGEETQIQVVPTNYTGDLNRPDSANCLSDGAAEIKFESRDTAVASVDSRGLLRAVAPGSTTIIVTRNSASFLATVEVWRPK